ncbi:MAG: hypothetical protein Q4F18_11395, partial [Clostridia bacterium]|nr:hypothetical protein [Clostridia bacterium]
MADNRGRDGGFRSAGRNTDRKPGAKPGMKGDGARTYTPRGERPARGEGKSFAPRGERPAHG